MEAEQNLTILTEEPERQRFKTPVISAGAFPRVWRYPETEVDGNPNITQQPLTNRTFWDNNPGGFID